MTTQGATGAPVDIDAGRPDPSRQPAGGIAAHVVAGTYVIGFLAMLVYLQPRGFTDPLTDPDASLDFLAGQPVAMYLWYLVLYLVGGVALPIVVLALHQRLRRASPVVVGVGTVFGLVWAGLLLAAGLVALVGQRAVLAFADVDHSAAVVSWHAISTVQDALGGGIELVGAVWLLVVCSAGLRIRAIPVGLAGLGLAIGIAGLATLVPAAAEISSSVFGLGLIVWFTWIAQTLLAQSGRTRQGGSNE